MTDTELERIYAAGKGDSHLKALRDVYEAGRMEVLEAAVRAEQEMTPVAALGAALAVAVRTAKRRPGKPKAKVKK